MKLRNSIVSITEFIILPVLEVPRSLHFGVSFILKLRFIQYHYKFLTSTYVNWTYLYTKLILSFLRQFLNYFVRFQYPFFSNDSFIVGSSAINITNFLKTQGLKTHTFRDNPLEFHCVFLVNYFWKGNAPHPHFFVSFKRTLFPTPSGKEMSCLKTLKGIVVYTKNKLFCKKVLTKFYWEQWNLLSQEFWEKNQCLKYFFSLKLWLSNTVQRKN